MLNIALGVLFGVLHQGGVVPSLFRIHDILYDPTTGVQSYDFHVVYWKTYMPPRHLLAIRREGMLASKLTLSDTLNIFADVISQKISVSDFAGSSPETVVQGLQGVVKSTSTSLSTILVAPFHSVGRLGEDKVRCLTERDRVFPHLDLDHIGETVEVGWKDGLSLGIFDVDRDCLNSIAQI